MNKILKAILGIGHTVVDATVPGAAAVTAAAETIIAARGTPGRADDAEAIFQTSVAGLALVEALGGQFATEPDFQAGLGMAKAGFTLMAKAIKAHRPV